MSTKTIHLTGHMDVTPDHIDAVTAAVVEHIALSRAEDGCLSFDVTPCPTVSGRFLVSESFIDRTAFDHHQTRTKASPWAEITTGFPREYTITKGAQ